MGKLFYGLWEEQLVKSNQTYINMNYFGYLFYIIVLIEYLEANFEKTEILIPSVASTGFGYQVAFQKGNK